VRALFAALLFLAVSSCASRPAPDEAALSRAGDFASGVERQRLVSDVDALVAAHRADTPLDCGLFAPSETDTARRPVCNLTREKARQLVRERFESLGYTVTTHDTADERFPTSTVIAEVRGTEHPDEVVVVGAHYDAYFSGADDNSSGVAAMLEMARLASGRKFARTVRFLGFDLEELGLVGSTRYVEEQVKGEKVVAALILDSIGYRNTAPDSQQGVPPLPFPSTADFILATSNAYSSRHADEMWALNQRLGLTRMMTIEVPGNGNGPATGDLVRSDHAPFWLAGKPALMLGDTAELRSPYYHQPTDTPDTLDPEFVAEVVRLSAVSLAYWAGGVR